jgi:lysine 2,3-aminomutase
VYCRFCTRSYAVGAGTDSVTKKPQKPSRRRWEAVFDYIESHPDLEDIVVSGGDAYYLPPDDLRLIGERYDAVLLSDIITNFARLLGMDNIRRIRFASKGLAVAPGRIEPGEPWTEALIDLSKQGRKMGKQVCLHTHINHAREITWVTRKAANYLFEHGVIVRNQSVLLKGVNNTFEDISELIKTLTDINIQPVSFFASAYQGFSAQIHKMLSTRFTDYVQYYVYQCDMVKGVEDLRTPLHEIRTLDKQLRGTLSGFMMPSFVIDLPGGGGKRLVSTDESYDEETGVATYMARGLPGDKGRATYYYYDPKPVVVAEILALREKQAQALKQGQTLEQVIQPHVPKPRRKSFIPELPMPALGQDVGRTHRNNTESPAGPAIYSWQTVPASGNYAQP